MELKKKVLFSFFSLIAFLLITLAAAECSLRLYKSIFKKIPFSQSPNCMSDPKLGWKHQTVEGDPKSKKLKIMIIGDSYTYGSGVKAQYMYYCVIRNKLNAEIFAYSSKGYGTLQEYLVLDDYFDSVKPDLVILQACSNDFINNSWELENRSFYNNTNFVVRPYLKHGNIEYRLPKSLGKWQDFVFERSQILYALMYRIQKLYTALAHHGFLRSVEQDISEKGIKLKDFRDAVETTGILVEKIKQRAGNATVIAFPVDDYEPYFTQFKDIFKKHNIVFLEQVPGVIKKAYRSGVNVYQINDTHYNEAGNQIIGNVLVEELRKMRNE